MAVNSYTKHSFQDGNLLTATQLNDIDNQVYNITEAIKNNSGGGTTVTTASITMSSTDFKSYFGIVQESK